MDFVPASDDEDISFPAPLVGPKSNPPEDPYSFEALVGTYTTVLIMFTSTVNSCFAFCSYHTTLGPSPSGKVPIPADRNSEISINPPRRRTRF
jgi:hypothetical protein